MTNLFQKACICFRLVFCVGILHALVNSSNHRPLAVISSVTAVYVWGKLHSTDGLHQMVCLDSPFEVATSIATLVVVAASDGQVTRFQAGFQHVLYRSVALSDVDH